MLALVSDAFGGRGGIAQYNRDFLGAGASAPGIDAIRILPRYAPDAFSLPAKITQAAPGTSRLGYLLRALARGFSRDVGIVFCGHINYAPLAATVARLARAKLIVQLHGIEAWNAPGALKRKAVEAADLVLCVSRYTRARLLSWARIAPERVLVLPNTVGEAFTPGDAGALRRAWGLDGKTVLLTVARMDSRERYKGHEKVIAALSELATNIVYVVLGEGDDAQRIRALAQQAGVADRVLFKGAVDQATLIAAYRMADLFVMPSTGEGFGIAYLEAMASGTPALGVAVAGAPDALADGELGAAPAPEDFPAALRRLAAPKPDGAALAASVRKRYGHQAFTDAVHRALSRV